jgi:thiamine pyrophosphate-dependent acetolactate synthase large subunit-like protein
MYHCSSPGFDVLTLVNAYGGRGFQCKTVGELRTQLKSAVESNCGITLLEIPVDPNSDKLSREISMLNLFIQMKNGKQGAIEAWDLAVAG